MRGAAAPDGGLPDARAWRATKARRLRLRRAHREAFAALLGVLREADLMHLHELGCPPDEYEPEVGTLLPRLVGAPDVTAVRELVAAEFESWFGEGSLCDVDDRLDRAAGRIVAEVVPLLRGTTGTP